MAEIEVDFHPEARQDYLDALAWYIGHSEALGRRFQRAVSDSIDRIAEGPERCPVFEQGIRWTRLRRFPYVIYFEQVARDRVGILAVAHGRRRPGYWRGRRRK